MYPACDLGFNGIDPGAVNAAATPEGFVVRTADFHAARQQHRTQTPQGTESMLSSRCSMYIEVSHTAFDVLLVFSVVCRIVYRELVSQPTGTVCESKAW